VVDVVKSFRLGFPPLTNEEYIELLRNIDKLSEPDQKALKARARAYELPAALTEAEKTSRESFPNFHDFAKSCTANDMFPTSEEQLEGERLIIEIFNVLAESAGWGVRLEHTGSPRCADSDYADGGIAIVQTRDGGYEEAKTLAEDERWRGLWFAGFFKMLYLAGESPKVHPALYKAQADRTWRETLGRRRGAKHFFGYDDSQSKEDLFRERQHKDKVEGAAATWNAALDRQKAEGIVPTQWPHRWSRQGFLSLVKTPHALPPDAHGPIDNRNGALTPFPHPSHISKIRKTSSPPQRNPDTRTLPTYIDGEGIVDFNDEDKLKDERQIDAPDDGED
jgi:hypothetical protein